MGQYYITQCNAVIIITKQVINVISFVFVQNKCVKISEENESFLILWEIVLKVSFPCTVVIYPLFL